MRLIITYRTGVKSEHKLSKKIWNLSREICDDLMRKNPDIVVINLRTES